MKVTKAAPIGAVGSSGTAVDDVEIDPGDSGPTTLSPFTIATSLAG